jgi:hypothetical protein
VDVAQRCELVFGSAVDAPTWEAADGADQRRLIDKRFGEVGAAQVLARSTVINQILSGEPPEVWRTAQRLTSGGVTVDRAISQLTMVFLQSITDRLGDGAFDEDTCAARLERLPLPGPAEVERVLLDVAAGSVVLPTGDLVAGAAERLGFDRDDPIAVRLIERVEEHLTDEFGGLVWLSGDRTAHTSALRERIVLTHVLSEPEKAIGALSVSFDLAGFGGVEEPSTDGAPVEAVSAESGHLAWWGPDGGWTASRSTPSWPCVWVPTARSTSGHCPKPRPSTPISSRSFGRSTSRRWPSRRHRSPVKSSSSDCWPPTGPCSTPPRHPWTCCAKQPAWTGRPRRWPTIPRSGATSGCSNA